jgi:hypothetical protein
VEQEELWDVKGMGVLGGQCGAAGAGGGVMTQQN